MKTLLGQRYGTHGTTSVISFLSRFSQQVVRPVASLALQLRDLGIDRRDVVDVARRADLLRDLRRQADERVVRVTGLDDRAGVEQLREEGVRVGVVLPPAGPLGERDVLRGGLDGRVRAVDRVHLQRDPDLRGVRLDDRNHARVDTPGVGDHEHVLAGRRRALAGLARVVLRLLHLRSRLGDITGVAGRRVRVVLGRARCCRAPAARCVLRSRRGSGRPTPSGARPCR